MRRGISPASLLAQVENTAPFLFDTAAGAPPYAATLLRARSNPDPEPDALGYFRLLLSAHWATAGTFVPTDVDNAIRYKLWNIEEDAGARATMADLVVEALAWDYGPVTARVARAPSGARMSTHEGTWFSVAVGAYAALREADPERACRVLEAVSAELAREGALLEELEDSGGSLEYLKACALIAHNLGDLDRVADQWELPESDPLRRRVYDAGRPGCAEHRPSFARAGTIYTAHLGPENSRHYPLRRPRCLRRRRSFLLPVGPFFDDWGASLGDLPSSGLSAEEAGEVVRALIDGFQRLPGTVGYARALAGILETFPGGMEDLGPVLPSRDVRLLRSGPLRAAISLPRDRFEARWRNKTRSLAAAL